MNNINEIFTRYTDLEKDNSRIEKELERGYQALEEISNGLDSSTLRILNHQDGLEEKCIKARQYFKFLMPLSFALITVVNIMSGVFVGVPLGTTIFDMFLSSAIYLGLSYSTIKSNIECIREYRSNEAILNGEHKDAITRLRELRELAKSYGKQQKLNQEEMEKLGQEIIRALSLGIEEEYHRQGIDEKVDISEAKIIANTNNRLELTLRKGDKNNG